jgi:hypothetical protein
MADLQKRSGYTPRKAREQRAYRLVQVGGTTGALGVVTLVLGIAGVVSLAIPVILLIITAICVFMFRGVTGQR